MERPGKAIGRGADSVAIEAPGWKGLWREDKTWYPVTGLESLKSAQERLLVKVHPSSSRDLRILKMPVPWDYRQGGQQV